MAGLSWDDSDWVAAPYRLGPQASSLHFEIIGGSEKSRLEGHMRSDKRKSATFVLPRLVPGIQAPARNEGKRPGWIAEASPAMTKS